eukprot:TRINITY_DN25874_c0_g1_i1.p2 TRINITY_DN25874_c0_g1~~TRINITY_DN25874_c0_g1_i1.p2  ORF type:complete len:128 (-),score=51.25 TRINITY_DN25874_c0_g1_i1:37-420(-)
MVFFFQAEDGIRDVERSRGLGDVYKRQVEDIPNPEEVPLEDEKEADMLYTAMVTKGKRLITKEKMVAVPYGKPGCVDLVGDGPVTLILKSDSKEGEEAVSYTHLTLPTILLVQISVVAVSLKKKKNL